MEWEYKVTNKSWSYREVVEWEVKANSLSGEAKSMAWSGK